MKKHLAIFAALVVGFAANSALAQDTLTKIKGAGKIVVGVKMDYKPWAYLDPSGKIVGMEIDMANDVAEKLGVKLETVPVTATNRMEFLNQNRIDLIIATMGDRPDRRKVVGAIEPQYYASGGNVMSPKAAKLTAWSQLKGKKVCAIQGAYYNRPVAQHHGPELVVFPGVEDAKKALLGGSCVAFLFDSSLIEGTLAAGDPQWADYEMPLTTEDNEPWIIGVKLADLSGPFGQFMVDMSKAWHKSGRLIELEKRWGIKANEYLVEMRDKYKS